VADYFRVRQAKGPAWDHAVGRRDQAGWDAHAEFVDTLAEEGWVVVGGPLGEGDGEDALLVVDADDEEDVRRRLAADPWAETMLVITAVEPWSIWVGDLAPERAHG
jgi:uncharacterized protein YciI